MSSWVAKDNWWGKTPSHSAYSTGISRSPRRVADAGLSSPYTHVHSHHHHLHSPTLMSGPPVVAREYISEPMYTTTYAPSPAFVEPAALAPAFVEPPYLSPRYVEAPVPLASPVAARTRVVERIVRGREVAEAVHSQYNRVLEAGRRTDHQEQQTVSQAPVRAIRHREEAPSRLGGQVVLTPRSEMGQYIQDHDSGMVVREVGPTIRLGRAPIEWREPEAHVVLVGEEKKKKKKKKKHKKHSSDSEEVMPIRTTEQSLWDHEEEKRQILLATAEEAARAGEQEYYEGGATDYSGSQGKEQDSPLSEQTREVMQQLEEQDLAAMQMQSDIVQLQGVVGDRMRAMGLEEEMGRDSGNQIVIEEEEEEDEERGSGSFPDASSRSSQEGGTPEQF